MPSERWSKHFCPRETELYLRGLTGFMDLTKLYFPSSQWVRSIGIGHKMKNYSFSVYLNVVSLSFVTSYKHDAFPT